MALRKKRRKSIIDELFGNSLFEDTEKFFEEFPEELEGGYSISVTQTPEGTKVHAKVGKNMDAEALKRQLQKEYPNAEIEIEGGKKEPLIKEISTKTLKEEKQKT
ncbi:MAG: hypothetical protein QXF44_03370 [Candidatus Bathyarchaeia archaeon]